MNTQTVFYYLALKNLKTKYVISNTMVALTQNKNIICLYGRALHLNEKRKHGTKIQKSFIDPEMV